MKKVLFISNICKKIDYFSFSSMIAAKELGYDFHIAVNLSDISDKEISDYEIKYGITIHQIDFIRNPFHPANYIAYKQMMVLMKSEKFDMVHCNTPVGGMIGRICSNKTGIRNVIYMAHGFHFYKGAPFINRTLFKWAEMLMAHYTDAIITINQEDYEAAQKFKLRCRKNVFYIPGVGLDTSALNNVNPKKKEILEEIKADNNSILIISVGEINRNKNNKVIIKAIKKLNKPEIHYILCGVGENEDELISIVKENNLEGNVHFLGYRSDIPQLLKSCDIFAMPSYREGLSRAMMEAMASGLPCIVSKIRGNIDLIEAGKGGYLCEPNDVDGFVKAILELSKNEKIRIGMGESNIKTVKKYDVENVKLIMKEIYNVVLSTVVINEKNL